MTTQIRIILLTGLFSFCLLTGLQAQDKYAFATVSQYDAASLRISIEGKPLEIVPLPKGTNMNDHAKLFDYVAKMQNEGWEVFNAHEGTFSNVNWTMTFVLRKKRS